MWRHFYIYIKKLKSDVQIKYNFHHSSISMNNIIPVIIGTVAGTLVIIAASIPGWIVMKYPRAGYSSYVSLFYGLTCSDYCQVYSYGEIYNYDNFTNMKGR